MKSNHLASILVVLASIIAGCVATDDTIDTTDDEAAGKADEGGATGLFAQYPQNQTFTLSTGKTVKFPLHLRDYDQLVLIGAADRASAQAELAATGLFVAPLTDLQGNVLSETLTSVSLFVIDYHNTSLGAYRETIVTIPVFDATGRFGYYVLAMDVTSRLSRLAGREVLGLPKVLGTIATHMPAKQSWSFDYSDAAGHIASGSCDACGALPSGPLDLDFQVATTSPITNELVWFRLITQTTKFSVRPYDPQRDAFWLSSQTPIGTTLGHIGFAVNASSQWLVSRSVKGVTFAP